MIGWVSDVENAQWGSTVDIKTRYSTASFLSENVVVFNVKGNDYRLEVKVSYEVGTVLIKWVGTHAEYDERNKARSKR